MHPPDFTQKMDELGPPSDNCDRAIEKKILGMAREVDGDDVFNLDEEETKSAPKRRRTNKEKLSRKEKNKRKRQRRRA